MRKKGFETDIERSERGTVNDEKLANNISRSRSKINEYAKCNDFDWFITLTIDGQKYNREDLRKYYKDFSQWLRNYCKKFIIKVKYIFIPELHKDRKSWHMHGIIKGIPIEHLKMFTEGDNVPVDLILKGYYNWQPYALKFGFVSLAPIRNREACSNYITKYINKDLSADIQGLNANLYYCSKGLETAEIMKKGSICGDIEPDFKNDYVAIKWFDSPFEAEKLILDN